jgi:hypothetical protein
MLQFSLSLLGLTAQLPFMQTPFPESTQVASMSNRHEFSFKEGLEVFAPKDLVGLARPGSGVANENGDLVLVPVSKYSFEEKK